MATAALGVVGAIGALSVFNALNKTPDTSGIANAQPTQPVAPAATQAKKPNVLLILADDMGWSDIGCYGGEIKTPNIDALAQSGLRFTQFYNSARCCPSRASLLTGLHPHQAGFPDMSGVLSSNAVTLPEALKPAGYNTYMVGKWHLSEQSTPVKRGFDEFYGMLGGFNSFWQEHPYYTRLPADHPTRNYPPGSFYSTNAFGDYAIDFMNQGREANKPWFMYLSFNAAHFPLHAPEDVIEKYEGIYAQGWDKIRESRFARQKQLGLVPQNMQLPPRSIVPRNRFNAQTGWADKQNPAWDSLPADRRGDLARRMAVYAAMVEIMDRNIGRVVAHLKETGEYNNTLIFFLSDNGACAEWDPFGFDKLDSTLNIVHTGADLKKVGTQDSYVSYGSAWANAGDTPWRLYKHYGQEGGIRTPLIVHWPAGLTTKPGALNTQPGAVIDFMPTLLQVSGATYPKERNGESILPMEGTSLVPIMHNQQLAPRELFMEHEGNRMVRDGDWKLVGLSGRPWELYDLAKDPTEMNDLSATDTAHATKLANDWEAWAMRCNVKPKAGMTAPQIANQPLAISCDVTTTAQAGVILAQGGNRLGYALYLRGGKPVFGVRQRGQLYEAVSPDALPAGKVSLEAHLAKDGAMTLMVNGKVVAQGKTPGLIPNQPQDGFTVGEDTQSPVGDYESPSKLNGKVENVKVTPGQED